MKTTVQAPDGGYITVEHPEGATQAQIIEYAQKNYNQKPADIGASGLPEAIKDTLPKFGTLSKTAMGAYAAIDQPALRLKQLFGGGLTKEDEVTVSANRTILKESPAATGGNILMNLLALNKAAPSTVGGSAALGGTLGFMEPTLAGESTAKNVATGAVLGAGGNIVARGAARMILPKAVERSAPLLKEGATPTPGQALGGFAQRAEEGLTSVPLLGDAIRVGQKRAVEQFNRAAINRSLEPIGKRLDGPVGREGVSKAGEMIGQAYDDLLPNLKVVADQKFVDDLIGLRGLAQNLPKSRAEQFDSILRSEVIDKFTDAGRMSGETMKAVESKLGSFTRRYGSSPDADQRMLGDALQEAQRALRAVVQRANPEQSAQLSKINEAYANLLRVENAAGRLGSAEGVFSPEALRGSVRAMDSSLRKRAFTRGDALMQDLAESGVNVLGKKVPDSGTPFRSLMATGPLGLGMGVVSSPLGLLYTPWGQQAATGLLARRPEMAAKFAGAVRAMGRLSPVAGPALLQNVPQ